MTPVGFNWIIDHNGFQKYLFSYQFVIFKFFWINSIFIIKISVSLHDSNALGSCTVQITASMETHITKSLFINNIKKNYKYTMNCMS